MTSPTRTKTRGGCRGRLRVVAVLLLLCGVLSSGGDAASNGAVDNANCALCQGLKYCTAMNGKLLFDPVIGYTREKTSQLEKQGVCEDMDAKTLELSKFGDQYQFKDTERCHKLVWNYHCLSLVAATFQRVINGVALSCDHAASSSVGKPLPPCRSLCVEVADKCVYSHFYRDYLENVCGNVPCVSEEQEANSGGTLKQAACIKAPWESVPNTSFSRCSIREYVPPKAHAPRPFNYGVVLAISTLNALLLATPALPRWYASSPGWTHEQAFHNEDLTTSASHYRHSKKNSFMARTRVLWSALLGPATPIVRALTFFSGC